MESSDNALINFLPNEMIVKIFGYLKQNQLGQIARVCKRWNTLTRSPVLWKKVNVKFSPSHESQTTVAKFFINALPPCVTHIKLDFGLHYYWTEKLDFEELSAPLQKRCPHLEMLLFNHAKLLDGLPYIIDLCAQFLEDMKILVFRRSRFPRYFETGPCDAISKIQILDLSWCKLVHFNKPSFSNIPRLKQLCLSNTFADDSWFKDNIFLLNNLQVLDLGDTSITSRTFQVIKNHGLNLKELYLCYNADLVDDDLNLKNSVFPQLHTICLKCYRVTCEGVVSFVKSCPSLKNVYIKQEVAEIYATHHFVVLNTYFFDIVKVINCGDHAKDYLYISNVT